MHGFRLWRFGLAMWLALFTLRATAVAQDDPARSASARTLFEEGVQLAEQGRWSDASDRFRRALALRDSAVIRFNLAAALAQQDQVVEASELLRGLLRTQGLDPSVKGQAEERLAQASARIAKLRVQTAAGFGHAQLELDGRALPAELVGVAMPVNPGAHSVRLVHQGAELDRQQLNIAPAGSATLVLASKVPTPAQTARSTTQASAAGPVLAASTSAHKDDLESGKRKKRLWWGIGCGAAALVAGAVITGVLLAQRAEPPHAYDGDFEPGSVAVKVNP